MEWALLVVSMIFLLSLLKATKSLELDWTHSGGSPRAYSSQLETLARAESPILAILCCSSAQ